MRPIGARQGVLDSAGLADSGDDALKPTDKVGIQQNRLRLIARRIAQLDRRPPLSHDPHGLNRVELNERMPRYLETGIAQRGPRREDSQQLNREGDRHDRQKVAHAPLYRLTGLRAAAVNPGSLARSPGIGLDLEIPPGPDEINGVFSLDSGLAQQFPDTCQSTDTCEIRRQPQPLRLCEFLVDHKRRIAG